MITPCPTCGADVEFRFDDSFVRVCAHCRAAVARTDRGIETLGKVADLVPSSSPLALGLAGTLDGVALTLVGHAQIRHPTGVWDEWYARLDDGRWGWLSEADGRYDVTFEAAGPGELPAFAAVDAGDTVILTDGGRRTFTVGEKGEAALIAAEGELPYRYEPGATFRYVDLSDDTFRFATIDYGPPKSLAAPTLYLGRLVTLADLGWADRGPARGGPTIRSTALVCASCGGAVEVRVPEQTRRYACVWCDAVLDLTAGHLTILAKQPARPAPRWPLGSTCRFDGVAYTLVGMLRRVAVDDDGRWPFDEYLLHDPDSGYRWLVEDHGHWSFGTPLPPGAVDGTAPEPRVSYDKHTFKIFARGPFVTEGVIGEMFWTTAVGDQVLGTDYVAPPAQLSSEEGTGEVEWTFEIYKTAEEVAAAFGTDADALPPRKGVGAHQPFPHPGLLTVSWFAVAAFFVVWLVLAAGADERPVHDQWIRVPVLTPGEPPHVAFTEPFSLSRGDNVRVTLNVPSLANEWLFVAFDLIDEDTWEYVGAEAELDAWVGADWEESNREEARYFAPGRAGLYVLRLEVTRGVDGPGTAAGVVAVDVQVHQDVVYPPLVFGAAIAIGAPGLLFVIWYFVFAGLRWNDALYSPNGKVKDD